MAATPLTKAEVIEVLNEFDFFHGEVDSLNTIPQRLINQNARFLIDGREWVIKRYDANNAPRNLRLSHEVQSILHDHGTPVAKLEISKSGDSLITKGPFIYSIHQWMHGTHYNFIETGKPATDELIKEVASHLGNLHLTVAKSHPQQTDYNYDYARNFFRSAANTADELTKPNRFGIPNDLRFKWHPNKSKLDRWIMATLPKFQTLAHDLVCFQLDHLRSLQEVILTHNDINWLNLIFDQNNKLVAIIDFDNIQPAPRQTEIGAAALVIAGSSKEKIAIFMNQYQLSSGLSVDTSAVYLSMLARCARSFLWSVQAYRKKAIKDVPMLEAWMKYLDHCLNQFLNDSDFQQLINRR